MMKTAVASTYVQTGDQRDHQMPQRVNDIQIINKVNTLGILVCVFKDCSITYGLKQQVV